MRDPRQTIFNHDTIADLQDHETLGGVAPMRPSCQPIWGICHVERYGRY